MDQATTSRKRRSDCSSTRYNLRSKSNSQSECGQAFREPSKSHHHVSGCRLGSVDEGGNGDTVISLDSEPSIRKTNDANNNRERSSSSKSVKASPSLKYQTEFGPVTASPTYSFPNLPRDVIWCGSFKIVDCGKVRMCEAIRACPPTIVSRKASEFSEKIGPLLDLTLHPRTDFYPDIFQDVCPDTDDIALYFCGSSNYDWSRQQYEELLKDMIEKDLMLRSHVGGREFMVFPSSVLREDCQLWKNNYFMWGVFGRGKQEKYSLYRDARTKVNEGRLKVVQRMRNWW